MTWTQIVTSVIVIAASTVFGIFSVKDFNIIKKEAGFKFDANEALEKITSNLFFQNTKNNSVHEQTIQSLTSNIEQLKKLNTNLTEKIEKLTNNNNSQINNFWIVDTKLLLCGAVFVAFTIFVSYKYLRIKKMHRQLVELSNHQLASSRKLIEFYNFFSVKNRELADQLTQGNVRFEAIRARFEAEDQIKFDKDRLKEKIKTSSLTSFNKSCKDFQLGLNCQLNKKKLKSFEKKLENLSLNWYKNLMNPSFILTDRTSNSVLLLSIVTSFILINYIDFHFPEFVTNNKNLEPNAYLTSSEGFLYDFLKIEDYVWNSNKNEEIVLFNLEDAPFETKTCDIGIAFDKKKNIMISNFERELKAIMSL